MYCTLSDRSHSRYLVRPLSTSLSMNLQGHYLLSRWRKKPSALTSASSSATFWSLTGPLVSSMKGGVGAITWVGTSDVPAVIVELTFGPGVLQRSKATGTSWENVRN
jgi:hypothetical protein